jgi:hypothetical protein
VAERSKARVFGRSVSGIMDSNPAGDRMSVSCEYCVLLEVCATSNPSSRDFYQMWLVVCDLETLRMKRPWPALGCCASEKKNLEYAFSGIVKLNKLFGEISEGYSPRDVV